VTRAGTIESLPSGRFRVRRKDVNGKYRPLGTFDTEDEAELALAAPFPTASDKIKITLRSFGEEYLERRKASGIRDIRTDRSRWEIHIGPDPIAVVPLRELRPKHVRDWRDRLRAKGLAPSTIRNTLNLLRCALQDAVERDMVRENVAKDVKLHRSAQATTDEGWRILNPDDQLALLRSVPRDYWHHLAFALGTGVRNHEQWSLLLEDIDLDGRVVTIRSGKSGATKSGKVRRVPLFGLALDAAREAVWAQKRGCRFAFPCPRTNRRRATDHPRQFKRWLKVAGLDNSIRWYDLRHTCATALLAGWWGRKWSLDEVCQMLGHSDTGVTQRYAHFLAETLMAAGAGTGFHADLEELIADLRKRSESLGASLESRTPDLWFTNPRAIQRFSGLAVVEFHARSTAPDCRAAAAILEATALACTPGTELRVRELLREAAESLQGQSAEVCP